MRKGVVTEIVGFQAVEGVTTEQMIALVDHLEQNFHSRQKGFIDTELLRGREDGQFVMVQHWETRQDCKVVVGLMMKESVTEPFRNALEPKTVKMHLADNLGYWDCAVGTDCN